MDRELTRAELDELLALYAVDALEGDERDQVARYLERDEPARTEVQSLREAAAFLARADVSAPVSLWASIEGSLGDAPAPRASQHLPPFLVPHRALPKEGRRRPIAVAGAVLTAVAISAITVLGVKVANQQDRIDELAAQMHHNTMKHEAAIARAAPGAHTIRLASTDGTYAAQIVMLPDGTGYFTEHNLPRLTSTRTYQLWANVGDTATPRMVSLGVLGNDPRVVVFRLAAPASEFELTREPATGSPQPGPMVLGGTVS
jgi:anti-sigma-K factor RskA